MQIILFSGDCEVEVGSKIVAEADQGKKGVATGICGTAKVQNEQLMWSSADAKLRDIGLDIG